ncbi:MAG: SRPBCC family protein [Actinomycetota bacterium]
MAELRSFVVRGTTTAKPEEVWKLVSDGMTWPTWSPIGSCVREGLDGLGQEQVGTFRTFKTGFVSSYEEVTELVPTSKFTYSLRKGMPLLDHEASIELIEEGGETLVTWSEEFRPKIPMTGAFFEWFLRSFISKCLNGLLEAARR